MKVTSSPSTPARTRGRMRRDAERLLFWADDLPRAQRGGAFHAEYVEKLANDVLTLLADLEDVGEGTDRG